MDLEMSAQELVVEMATLSAKMLVLQWEGL